jgi:uncharacterized protein YcaQ
MARPEIIRGAVAAAALLSGLREENELGWWTWAETGGLTEGFIAGRRANKRRLNFLSVADGKP